mmetsp:Transcript_14510/g.17508  ORF Transcript_14510/g.17508 Transcript_14510/m.17508 type:complete len:142 (+) Transcript_14510:79-504(+)
MSRPPPIPTTTTTTNNDGSGGAGNDQSADPLVESLLSSDRDNTHGAAATSGALCNDPSGLCLGSRGAIDSSKSGIYTSLVRLAAQIDHGGHTNDVPLITIETQDSAVLVKEYDGHTVALRVPKEQDTVEISAGAPTEEDTS